MKEDRQEELVLATLHRLEEAEEEREGLLVVAEEAGADLDVVAVDEVVTSNMVATSTTTTTTRKTSRKRGRPGRQLPMTMQKAMLLSIEGEVGVGGAEAEVEEDDLLGAEETSPEEDVAEEDTRKRTVAPFTTADPTALCRQHNLAMRQNMHAMKSTMCGMSNFPLLSKQIQPKVIFYLQRRNTSPISQTCRWNRLNKDIQPCLSQYPHVSWEEREVCR